MAKILIADDEKDIRDLIKMILELSGHQVAATKNGEEAVAMVGDTMPDLILLDMRMPKLSGLEACEMIKSQPATAHIPVVFLSGNESSDDLDAAQSVGANGFITKPFDPQDLIGRIAEFLG